MKKRWRVEVFTGTVLVVLTACGSGTAAQSLAWQIDGKGAVVEGTGGRTLRLGNAVATLVGSRMVDGTVSFVLQAPAVRSFVGVQTRVQETGPYEDFYFRPHKSGLPDAVQYTPSFNGQDTNWQLFHGPGGTAAAPTHDDARGIRMEIALSGRHAAVFVGEAEEPVLVVPRLALEPSPGSLKVWSSVLQPTADTLPVVIRDFEVRPRDVRPFSVPEPSSAPDGAIMRWSVSPAFLVQGDWAEQLPADVRWRTLDAEPDGTLLLNRHVAPPAGDGMRAVAASVTLDAPRAETVRLELGFSDKATVFLNGAPIYQGDLSYSYDAPARMGLLVPEQNALYLPLRPGRNELIVLVSEVFGGWAVAGRVTEGDVTVRPLG